MDSTLLDQIRYLCRDRAAYEHLKAILVQRERVHQLSWEERYEKLMSAKLAELDSSNLLRLDTDQLHIIQSHICRDIIAREKTLAQLAEAIQRSPSLDLILPVAVRVAQELVRGDRVAIFRCHPNGRGEFVTDAFAEELISLADMPERLLSLTRHIIESVQTEGGMIISADNITVDSVIDGVFDGAFDGISNPSPSSHFISLLQQMDISSYVVNNIYVEQEVWGILVAFRGNSNHNWTSSWMESDRTSLSLIAVQIGIALSLTNLRQQSQDLNQDLHTLRLEIDDLQKTVAEIAKAEIAKAEIAKAEITKPEITKPEIADIQSEDIDLETETISSEALILEIFPELKLEINDAAPDPFPVESSEQESINAESKPESSEQESLEPESVNLELSNQQSPEPESSEPESVNLQFSNLEPESANLELKLESSQTKSSNIESPDLQAFDFMEAESEENAIQEVLEIESEQIAHELLEREIIGSELIREFPQTEVGDRDSAIEPQFIETILAIAGNGNRAIDFLLDVIDSYLANAPHLIQAIDRGINHQKFDTVTDREQLLQSLDELRSSSDYIGALALSYQCRQLGSAINANHVVLIHTCFLHLQSEGQRAIDALQIERSRYILERS